MKLQNVRTIDFSKANQQIKDLSHKFLKSKMLRKNKENCNPNSNNEAAAKLLLEALQKPLLRNLRDLILIKESVVCERNIFDEICSVGCSENMDVGDGFKISFANLSVKQESIIDCQSIQPTNAPVLMFMVLQNMRKKKLMVSFQEIKFFILQKNFTQVNFRLQYVKKEQLRKVVVNKMKQEQLLMQVYLKYWSQQTQLLIFFGHFGSRIDKIYSHKLQQYFQALNIESAKREGLKKITRIISKKIHEHVKSVNKIHINLHLQNCLWNICIRQLHSSFEQLSSLKSPSPLLFELLIQRQISLRKESLKILQLHALRQKRRYKSYEYGVQDLQKIMKKIECKWAINKLSNKHRSKHSVLATKFMIVVLKKQYEMRLNWGLLRLNQ